MKIDYVVVMPDIVEGYTDRLPLVLKKKPEHLAGMLNLPGGKIEAGESVIEAAVRELNEETGLDEVQAYDGMCYCPSQLMGVIESNHSIIHCVRVPVSIRQELKPGVSEIEEIKWYSFPDLLNIPNLMPNLRLTIPLMMKGITGWKILDMDEDWRDKSYHNVLLKFNEMEDNFIRVSVNSVGYYSSLGEEE